MAVVRFNTGSSLSYTLYDHKTTIRDDLHIRYRTTSAEGGLVQVQTQDPNQFIKLLITNEVCTGGAGT